MIHTFPAKKCDGQQKRHIFILEIVGKRRKILDKIHKKSTKKSTIMSIDEDFLKNNQI